MKKPLSITGQELQAIKLSVGIARLAALDDRIGAFRVYRRAARDASIPAWKVAQDVLLAQLRWFETRKELNWSSPSVKDVIVDALDRNDQKFLMRLSRALCRPPKRLHQATTKAEGLKHFLLDHWAERQDGLPELVFLTPIDAAEVCSQQLGFYVDDSTIVKLRQRLRLKPCRHKLYRLKPSGGGFAFVRVDKT